MCLEIRPLKVRVMSHENYLNGSIFEIADQFNIVYNKHFFPMSLKKNWKDVLHYNGPIPSKELFVSDFDSEALQQDKLIFLDNNKFQKWNFCKELVTYIQQKVFLLALSNLKFIKEFINFQKLLDCSIYFSPFDSPISSTGGAFFKLFKLIYLPKFTLYTVLNEYKSQGLLVSRGEHQVMSYFENVRHKGSQFLMALNNKDGQKYFKEAIPDGYAVDEKTCYFYNGCYTHKCTKHNLINNLDACLASNIDFDNKVLALLNNNPNDVHKVEIIWECEMDKFKKYHPDYEIFLSEQYIKRPLQRLVPRDAYKAGYFDTFILKWSYNDFPNENLWLYDVNGLYSFVAIKNKFMIGPYNVLIGPSLNDLKIIDNRFFFNNERVMGSVFLSILPPNDLIYPFLSYKAKNGMVYQPLCSKCCENRIKKCLHSEQERALNGTWMINEIEYALDLNYKILHVFECHLYTQSAFIFKDFVKKLVFCKTIACDLFENCKHEKELYCQKLNQQMDFEEPLLIRPEVVKPNAAMRYFYKMAQNSFFGKFGQRNDYNKTLFCTSQGEIDSIISENSKINNAYTIGENICCISYQPDKMKIKPSLKTQVYLSAQITSFAREEMHKQLMLLIHQKVKIVKINCDSFLFALNKTEKIPLKCSHAVGDFKNEICGQILNFFAVGTKNYIIVYKNEAGKICYVNKISGLSLQSNPLNHPNYTTFISNLHKDFVSLLKVPNKRQKLDWKTLTIERLNQTFTISNSFPLRRILQKKDDTYFTVPFGYQCDG